MYELTIPAMSCDHCKNAITKAALILDPDITLQFDLGAHKVVVGMQGPLAALEEVLAAMGYPVAAVAGLTAEARCCGRCSKNTTLKC